MCADRRLTLPGVDAPTPTAPLNETPAERRKRQRAELRAQYEHIRTRVPMAWDDAVFARGAAIGMLRAQWRFPEFIVPALGDVVLTADLDELLAAGRLYRRVDSLHLYGSLDAYVKAQLSGKPSAVFRRMVTLFHANELWPQLPWTGYRILVTKIGAAPERMTVELACVRSGVAAECWHGPRSAARIAPPAPAPPAAQRDLAGERPLLMGYLRAAARRRNNILVERLQAQRRRRS